MFPRKKNQKSEQSTIFAEEGVDIDRLKETFMICAALAEPKIKGSNKISKGANFILMAPWNLS